MITNPAIHEALSSLIEHCPPKMHVVVLSRTDPPIALALFRARGQLAEIRSFDLRFTSEEIKQYFDEVLRIDLSSHDADALEVSTEGWAAALQLAALSAQGRSDPLEFIRSRAGSSRSIFEYMLAEVMNRQSQEVQDFLCVTSVLERMCAPLCDALLSRADGEQDETGTALFSSSRIIEGLERANLFVVPLDETGYWYRYHHLFRDFLRERLQRTRATEVGGIHRRASEWYQAQGLTAEAMSHAFLTGDWAYAADLVECHAMPTLMNGEIRTLYEWATMFPEEVMRTRPTLHVLSAWTPALSHCEENRAIAEGRLEKAERALSFVQDTKRRRHHEGHIALVRSFMGMIPDAAADPEQEVALAQRALDLFPEDDPLRCTCELLVSYAYMASCDLAVARGHLSKARRLAQIGPDPSVMIDAAFQAVRIAHEQGQLRKAARSCRQARAYYRTLLPQVELHVPVIGTLDIAQGCILVEQDSLAEAESLLVHGLDLVASCVYAHYSMLGYITLFRLRELQGQSAEALRVLEQLEDIWPDMTFLTTALRVRHLLRSAPDAGDTLAAVVSMCGSLSPYVENRLHLPGMGPFGAAEAYYRAYLVWARAQTATGRPDAALAYLEQQLHHAELHGLKDRVISLSVEQAMALNAMGQNKRALDVLHRAVAAAEPEGYVRVFDEGPVMIELLTKLRSHPSVSGEYVDRLLDRFNATANTASPLSQGPGDTLDRVPERQPQTLPVGSPFSLTKQETALLHLVAQGLTNAAIAKKLYIEIGTVEQHMNHILRKLGATNRTRAVAEAQRLGLL